MARGLLARDSIALAERVVDRWFHGDDTLESVEQYLSENIDLNYQRELKDEAGKRKRTAQNQFIQLLLNCVDAHPLAVKDGDAASIRRVIWKYSGINCDDFTKLDIRTGVRFDSPEGGNLANFNPANITILTGGKKVFMTGLRGATYLDGSGKIVIYGAFNCASGVSIFTHDHGFTAPDRSLFEQGRTLSHTIVYPECFIGEAAYVFGNLNFRNIVAPKSISRLKVTQPPYAIVGGIGSGYGVKRALDGPTAFPPEFLKETIRNIRLYSERYGAHLETYAAIVGEFLGTDRKDWKPFQEEIARLESNFFDQD